MSQKWTAADIPDQSGRVAVVTGGNSGLGLETARELARHGARVILTARDPAKGQTAVADIQASAPDAEVSVAELDLASLDSVRAFAGGPRRGAPGPAHQQRRDHDDPAEQDGRRLRAAVRHQPPGPLRPHGTAAGPPGPRRRGARGHAVQHRAQARPAGLRRPPARAQLRPPVRLRAVEAGQRRVRGRARSPAARRGVADHQRPRPPRLLGHQPPVDRSRGSDEAHHERDQSRARSEGRDGSAADPVRGHRARRGRRLVHRARRHARGARPPDLRRRDGQGPATRRPAAGCGTSRRSSPACGSRSRRRRLS